MIGEIIYGHHGQFRVCQYGEISEQERHIFLDKTEIGANDSTNQVIVIEEEWIWSTLVIKESDCGREYKHAVYEENKPENLYDIAKLVDFPFCSAAQCEEYLGNEKLWDDDGFKATRNGDLGVCPEQVHDVMDIPKETIAELVCYIYDNIYKKNTDFLCILVPNDVVDYQKYCRSVINTLLGVLPVGLRHEVRIATNPSEKERKYYGIHFKRDNGEEGTEHDIRLNVYKGKVFENPISCKMQQVLQEFAGDISLVERCYKELECTENAGIKENNIEKLAELYLEFLETAKGTKIGNCKAEELKKIYSKRDELLGKLRDRPEKAFVQDLLDLRKSSQTVQLPYIFNKILEVLGDTNATRENFENIYGCFILLADRNLWDASLDKEHFDRFDENVKKYLSDYQEKTKDVAEIEKEVRFASVIINADSREEVLHGIIDKYNKKRCENTHIDSAQNKPEIGCNNGEESKKVQSIDENEKESEKEVTPKSEKRHEYKEAFIILGSFLGAFLGGIAAVILSLHFQPQKGTGIILKETETEIETETREEAWVETGEAESRPDIEQETSQKKGENGEGVSGNSISENTVSGNSISGDKTIQ